MSWISDVVFGLAQSKTCILVPAPPLDDFAERALRRIWDSQQRGGLTHDEAETLSRIVAPDRWARWPMRVS